MSELLLTNIGMLATPTGSSARRGAEQGQIQILRNAWVLISQGQIAQVGTGTPPAVSDAQVVDSRREAGDPRTGGRPHPSDLRRLAPE